MLRLNCLSRPRRSINIRYTTPGHANPYFLDRAKFVNPRHPAARLALSKLPAFVSPHFTIRAFPNAILHEPVDFVPINPFLATDPLRARTNTTTSHKWSSNNRSTTQCTDGHRPIHKEDRRRDGFDATRKHIKFLATRQIADARVAALTQSGKLNLSLLFHTSKKATSKSAVIRRRLRSKMTTAIILVVSRSVDAVGSPACPSGLCADSGQHQATLYPPLNLVQRPLSDNERIVLQDWTYLVIPELAIYKMPLLNLIQEVRKALVSLGHQSMRLESSWSGLPNPKPTRSHGLHSSSLRKRVWPR